MALISMAQWAKKQGFSRQYAHQLIQSGIISRVEGKIDEDQANAALMERRELTRPQYRKDSASAEPQNQKGLNQLWLKTRIRNEMTKGKLLQLDEKIKNSELVDIKQVETFLATLCTVTRDRLFTIPDRLQHELLALTDAATLHQTLSEAIREALTTLSEVDIARLIRQAPSGIDSAQVIDVPPELGV